MTLFDRFQHGIIFWTAGVVAKMNLIDPGWRDCAGWEFESNLPSKKPNKARKLIDFNVRYGHL